MWSSTAAKRGAEKFRKSRQERLIYRCYFPTIMMKKTLDLCNKYKIECESSLERVMKCSLGICGSCMINGKLVCRDGPIFNSKQLNKLSEFGNFARLKSGKKVTLKDYHSARV